jgi:hypothetical protein
LDNIPVIGLCLCSANLISRLHVSSAYIDLIFKMSDVEYTCERHSHTLHLYRIQFQIPVFTLFNVFVPTGTKSCRRVPKSCKRAWRKKTHCRCRCLHSDVRSMINNVHKLQLSTMILHDHSIMFSYSSHMVSYDTMVVSYLLHMRILRRYETHMRICLSYERI